ncbi:MAG: hypothetical protein MSH10_01800 [Pygmaiobacter massiliensis]|nr:hypothetical protein [Pygmaiobacter massiliensis]
MKKIVLMILSICVLFGFAGCTSNTDKMEVLEWTPSEIYTDEEIHSAIDVVCSDFRHWKGCKLDTITYAGDDVSIAHIDWATRYHFDQALVLVSSFSTNNNPEEPLEKNETYDNYKWILIRKDGGEWSHVDNGF